MEIVKSERKRGAVGRDAVFFGTLFLILFVFFTQVHPLVLFDADDWYNITYLRLGYPKSGIWNPSKIFPETLFPIVGAIAAYVVMPVTKDYVYSITLVSSMVVSASIVCYVFLFGKILDRFFKLKSYVNYSLIFLFFITHFLVFRDVGGGAEHLLWAGSLTRYFHYTVPALLNLCLVEYFIAYGLPKKFPLPNETGKSAILLLAVYLAVFSNMLNNIVLISFIIGYFLRQYGFRLFRITEWKFIIKENLFLIGIIILWLIALGVEMTGGRAHQIGASFAHLPIKQTLLNYWNSCKSFHKFFPIFWWRPMGLLIIFERKTKERKELLSHIGVRLKFCFFP